MLLDSDSSLKIAHDIIHDANEFLNKWGDLLANPDDSSLGEDSSVPEGHVEFKFSDGSVLPVPCAWDLFRFAEGDVREKIILRSNGHSETWKAGAVASSSGDVFGLIADGPVSAGAIAVNEVLGLASENNQIVFVNPQIVELTANMADILNAIIQKIEGGEFEINNSEFSELNSPDGEVDLNSNFRADAVLAETLTCSGEQIIPVEKVNAWVRHKNAADMPNTDAEYTEYIPFEALSSNGTPLNGFDKPLVDNPFYPDWIYVGEYRASWKPTYAWMPSATMPSAPYWQDEDGIYWHKVRVSTDLSMFGYPNLVWPMRTAIDIDGTFSAPTLPPMKADADGLIVSAQILSLMPCPIGITDYYERVSEEEWLWRPGVSRAVKGPRVCQFMAKRNFTWLNNQIVAVEYQFLPIGDING